MTEEFSVCVNISGSKEFIEARKRALKRFLTLVVRHPVLCEDRIVNFFLTVKGSVGQTLWLPFSFFLCCLQFLSSVGKKLHDSEVIIFFVFVLLQDIGQKMKDQFKSMPDEFMSSPLASKAKVLFLIISSSF